MESLKNETQKLFLDLWRWRGGMTYSGQPRSRCQCYEIFCFVTYAPTNKLERLLRESSSVLWYLQIRLSHLSGASEGASHSKDSRILPQILDLGGKIFKK